MHHQRSAAVAAAFLISVATPALTTTASASVRGGYTWTQQTVFALGPVDNYTAEWMGPGQGWTIIGGPAGSLYAGSAGVFATDQSTGDIFEYDGTPGSWTVIGGPAAEFVEGGAHLYALAPNFGYVAQWNGPGQGWTVIGGAATQLYAGPLGLFAMGPTGSSEDIWRYTGTPGEWTDIGAPGSLDTYNAVAVGSAAVYRIDPPNSAGATVVDEWTGAAAWTPILTVGSGHHLSDLIAGDYGVFLDDSTSTGDTYREYSGTPDVWPPITPLITNPDSMFPRVESATSLYGATLETSTGDDFANDVEVYSGSGTSWTVIGGPADPDLAAGG